MDSSLPARKLESQICMTNRSLNASAWDPGKCCLSILRTTNSCVLENYLSWVNGGNLFPLFCRSESIQRTRLQSPPLSPTRFWQRLDGPRISSACFSNRSCKMDRKAYGAWATTRLQRFYQPCGVRFGTIASSVSHKLRILQSIHCAKLMLCRWMFIWTTLCWFLHRCLIPVSCKKSRANCNQSSISISVLKSQMESTEESGF